MRAGYCQLRPGDRPPTPPVPPAAQVEEETRTGSSGLVPAHSLHVLRQCENPHITDPSRAEDETRNTILHPSLWTFPHRQDAHDAATPRTDEKNRNRTQHHSPPWRWRHRAWARTTLPPSRINGNIAGRSHASPTTSSQAPTTFGFGFPDGKVASRYAYWSPRRKRSVSALRSASAVSTG